MSALSEDFISRFVFEGLDIRGAFVRLGPAWQAMQQERDYPPAAAALLGELAAVTVLITSQLKQPGRMTFQLKGNGPVSLLVVDCDIEEKQQHDEQRQLRLRGMVRAQGVGRQTSVPELLGDGQLLLTLDSAMARTPYQSIVPLQGNTVSAIFQYYLEQSEQQETWLHLVSTPDASVGLFLQKMPAITAAANTAGGIGAPPAEHPEKDADGWNRVTQLAATVKAEELLQLSPERLLRRLFSEEDVRIFPARPVQYYCPYDHQKVVATLRALGRDEVMRIVDEQGDIEVFDEICNHHYRFGRQEAEAMFDTPIKDLH